MQANGSLRCALKRMASGFISASARPCKRRSTGPAGKPGVLAFISSEYGRPYTKESLGTGSATSDEPAGFVRRSAHGLRKAAARRFAEIGINEATLNAIFGWSDPRMAAYYVRQASMKVTGVGCFCARRPVQIQRRSLHRWQGRKRERTFPHIGVCGGMAVKMLAISKALYVMEASPGIEPGCKDLQSSA